MGDMGDIVTPTQHNGHTLTLNNIGDTNTCDNSHSLTYWVINPEPCDQPGGHDGEHSPHCSGHNGLQVGHGHAPRHDAHTARQDAIAGQHHLGLPLPADQAVEEAHHATSEGGQDGGDGGSDGMHPPLPTDSKHGSLKHCTQTTLPAEAMITWLKATQAHQIMKQPMMALVALPMAGSFPPSSHRPIRGPNILAA